MDFKSKGKSWAGNIFHQFESICQDVDDFMNKDTVKFVENQVQSVGVSVKRFYSNVVQDILPVSENSVSTKTQKHVNSVTDSIKEPTQVMEKQLSVNESSVDTMKTSCTMFSDELSHALKLTALFNADPSQVSKNGNSNHSSEEENIWDSIAPSAESGWENDIICELLDQNHKNSTANMDSSPAVSDDTECPATLSTIECNFGSKLLMDDPNTGVEKGFSTPDILLHSSGDPADRASSNSDDNRSVSAQSITPATCDQTIHNSLSAKDDTTSDSPLQCSSDPAGITLSNFYDNRSVSSVSINPATCDETPHNSVSAKEEAASDSPVHSSCDPAEVTLLNPDETKNASAQSITPAKFDQTPHDSFSSKDETTLDSSLHSSGDSSGVTLLDSDETRNVSAQSMTPAKFDGTIHDSISAKGEPASDMSTSFKLPELVFPYLTNEEGKNVMPSTCSTPLESSHISEDFVKKAESTILYRVECGGFEYKTADVLPANLVSETNVCLSESMHNQERLHKIGQSKYSSGIGNACEFGIGDLNMETIDLSSDKKLDQDIIVNSFSHLASHGRKNFKYYKKLIHGAFTSRKRLSKEYEHLPILYGDIDKEFSQHFQARSVPSSAQHFFHAFPEETQDNEWELL